MVILVYQVGVEFLGSAVIVGSQVGQESLAGVVSAAIQESAVGLELVVIQVSVA